MKNANILKKELENMFKEMDSSFIVDIDEVAKYIETQVCENLGIEGKGCEVEDAYIINNKKYIVFYNVDMEYKEAEDGRVVPHFTFNYLYLA